MAGAPDTGAILDQLRATRTSARERQSAMERTIREEARRLREGGGAGGSIVDGDEGPAPGGCGWGFWGLGLCIPYQKIDGWWTRGRVGAGSARTLSHVPSPARTCAPSAGRPGAGGVAAAVAARAVVDFDSLAFQGGSHFKSNKSTTLPEGSFRCGGGWVGM